MNVLPFGPLLRLALPDGPNMLITQIISTVKATIKISCFCLRLRTWAGNLNLLNFDDSVFGPGLQPWFTLKGISGNSIPINKQTDFIGLQ